MKIAFCSDLHLNHAEKSVKVACAKQIDFSNCDMVVIAGDIAEAHNFEHELSYFVNWYNKPTMYVIGNHCSYGSSFYDMNILVQNYSNRHKYAKHLPTIGLQELSPDTCLIGWDSMYDCQNGLFTGGRYQFELADFIYIDEIKRLSRNDIQKFMIEKGRVLAEQVKKDLTSAFAKYKNVIAITHVPPYPEVCLFNGRSSELEALPFFSNKQMGEALLDMIDQYKDNNLTLLCGHTHSACTKQIRDNFTVIVAGARYGNPKVFSYLDV